MQQTNKWILLTAKKGATSFYFPLLVTINVFHLFMTYRKRGLSTYRSIITILQWILTYASYQGILNDAQQGSYLSEKKLAGGAWLDLLSVVVLSQLGSLFVHEGFMDSMLFVLPALYGLKNYLFPSDGVDGGVKEPKLTKEDEETRKALEERRRKRAERRRQKRG